MGRVTRRKTYKDVTPEKRKHTSTPSKKTPKKSKRSRTQTPEFPNRVAPCSGRVSRHSTPFRSYHAGLRTANMAGDHNPYVDDGFPISQVPGEVGWDARAQYPVGGNSKQSISDIMKSLDKQKMCLPSQMDPFNLEAFPGTPPNLDLWRGDSPLSQDESEPVQPRRQRHRKPCRPKSLVAYQQNAVLSKLQMTLSNLKEKQEENREKLEAASEKVDDEPRRSERLSQKPKPDAESHLDISTARSNSLDQSADLFDTCAPSTALPTTKADPAGQLLCSTPKRPPGQLSCDDLWTDDDDSFMRLTQAAEQAVELGGAAFATPKGVPMKRKNCLKTPEGGMARKNGRFNLGPSPQSEVQMALAKSNSSKLNAPKTQLKAELGVPGVSTVKSSGTVTTTVSSHSTVSALRDGNIVCSSTASKNQHTYGTRNTSIQAKAAASANKQFVYPKSSSNSTLLSTQAAVSFARPSLPFQTYNNKPIGATSTKSSTMCSRQMATSAGNMTQQGVRLQRHQSMPVHSSTLGTRTVTAGSVSSSTQKSSLFSAGSNSKGFTAGSSSSTPSLQPGVVTRNQSYVAPAVASAALKTDAVSPPLAAGPRPSSGSLSQHNMSLIGSCSQFGARVLATSTQVHRNKAPSPNPPRNKAPSVNKLAFKVLSKPEVKLASATTIPSTISSKEAPAKFKVQTYEPLLDMSISDDVLATLAEPDEILDSQACMELLQSPEEKKPGSSLASTVGFGDDKVKDEDEDIGQLDFLMMANTASKAAPRRKNSVPPSSKAAGSNRPQQPLDDDDDGMFDDDVLNMIEEVELRASQEKQKETPRPVTRSTVPTAASTGTPKLVKVPSKAVPSHPTKPASLTTSSAAVSPKPATFNFKSSSNAKSSQLPAGSWCVNSSGFPTKIGVISGLLPAKNVIGSNVLPVKIAPEVRKPLVSIPVSSSSGYHSAAGCKSTQGNDRCPLVSTPLPTSVVNTSSATYSGVQRSDTSKPSPSASAIPATSVGSRPVQNGLSASRNTGTSTMQKSSSKLALSELGGVVGGVTGSRHGSHTSVPVAQQKSSSGSSECTNSPIKCSMEEIQKKRLEAMKKRENRLKLTKTASFSK